MNPTDPEATPLFTEAELIDCVRKPKPRPDLFLVLAYNRVNEYWSVRGIQHTTVTSNPEAAEKAASKLSSLWEPVRIVRIPGES